MSHTRLNSNHRAQLRGLVGQIVTCPVEIKMEETAYQKALPAALALLEARYPAKDMTVLARYDMTELEESTRVQLEDGGIVQFNFRPDDQPRVPKYVNQMYLANASGGRAIEHWRHAFDALTNATKAKRMDYEAFINSAATFEMVTDIWPEAMQLADRIKSNLPSTVSPEVLARIKADSKKRMKQAA